MPPALLSAAFLSHFFPRRESSDGPASVPDSGDPEKMTPNGSGSGQDQSFNEENDDRDDPDKVLDDFDEQEDTIAPEGAEEDQEDRPRQGVSLTPSTTMSSSFSTSVRPALPKFLVRIHEILFGTHHEREVQAPSYRRIPIFSGILIPFAILLQIPGLTEHWFVRTIDGQIVETSKNSAILTVSLAFSMALAVIANIALINRFLERAVKRSTIICIVALSLHGELPFDVPPHSTAQRPQIY
jgi:potassium channel subfamily K, other eukaryote